MFVILNYFQIKFNYFIDGLNLSFLLAEAGERL